MANSTCLTICTRALRGLGVLGASQEATGPDGADALQHLQDLIDDLPGLRKGDWVETTLTSTSAYTASDGERINTAGFNAPITFPTTYIDVDGLEAPVLDLSRVQIIGDDHDQVGLWIYAASNGAWARADALTLTDPHPFGPEDTAGLVALLASDMSPEFGEQATLSQLMIERAARQMRSFRARFRRASPTPVDRMFVATADTGNDGFFDEDLV